MIFSEAKELQHQTLVVRESLPPSVLVPEVIFHLRYKKTNNCAILTPAEMEYSGRD